MEPKFRFRFIAAPADLAPYVNTLFVFETDEARLDDILPAYSAQMIAFGSGEARMQFAPGEVARSSPAFLVAPMQEAAPFAMAGPVRACGVSLTAEGWAAVAGLPVDKFGHRKMDAAEVLSRDLAEALEKAGADFAAGHIDAEAACEMLAGIVRKAVQPILPAHSEFIAAMIAWLGSSFSPDLPELLAKTGLSERQVQRLSKRYFGKPPARLVRRYRAIRAATFLSQPDLRQQYQDEVTGAFFDQAHMIREIRLFTGRTPNKLGTESSVTSDTLGPDGYGMIDLFGATTAA
ncbi:helix-turn-helix domain-containing protein [Erythrobacter sp. SDW2]|uniref:helix-turn-helix domain-containing protein n=1 Tax=Erythrobacter sp. SDW2 TaxID=2907154 RepID=UPI001F186FFD|nr:helix-turn-helix domain-containing protein [Erythrobacter sp. SDW2]UIP07270.1 helix-turn-helix domain-containing protein [Erythrobacter sp. SDW2]